MVTLKTIILLLIISSIFVDARSLRKRRQISSGSYYISSVNPYSSSYSPTAPLTYPSGSFYTAPGANYPSTGYVPEQVYDSNYYGNGMNQYNPTYNNDNQNSYGSNQIYYLPNLGSTYGSGSYGSSLYGYGIPAFNNRYPNWNQGNSHQYYTGGTGAGLTNTGYVWYRSLRNVPIGPKPGENSAADIMELSGPPLIENPLLQHGPPRR